MGSGKRQEGTEKKSAKTCNYQKGENCATGPGSSEEGEERGKGRLGTESPKLEATAKSSGRGAKGGLL